MPLEILFWLTIFLLVAITIVAGYVVARVEDSRGMNASFAVFYTTLVTLSIGMGVTLYLFGLSVTQVVEGAGLTFIIASLPIRVAWAAVRFERAQKNDKS